MTGFGSFVKGNSSFISSKGKEAYIMIKWYNDEYKEIDKISDHLHNPKKEMIESCIPR